MLQDRFIVLLINERKKRNFYWAFPKQHTCPRWGSLSHTGVSGKPHTSERRQAVSNTVPPLSGLEHWEPSRLGRHGKSPTCFQTTTRCHCVQGSTRPAGPHVSEETPRVSFGPCWPIFWSPALTLSHLSIHSKVGKGLESVHRLSAVRRQTSGKKVRPCQVVAQPQRGRLPSSTTARPQEIKTTQVSCRSHEVPFHPPRTTAQL